jgi:hypothetical protein
MDRCEGTSSFPGDSECVFAKRSILILWVGFVDNALLSVVVLGYGLEKIYCTPPGDGILESEDAALNLKEGYFETLPSEKSFRAGICCAL